MSNPNGFDADPRVVSYIDRRNQMANLTQNFTIRSPEDLQLASNLLGEVKSIMKGLEDARTRITKPMNDALRETNAQAKAAIAPFLEIEARVKTAVLTFNRQEEDKRREAQRRADEEARKEREALERRAREAAAKAAQEAQERREAAAAAEAAGNTAEAERLAAQATRIEEKGDAKVDALAERAAQVVASVVPSAAPKAAGVAQRDNWTFRIVNAAGIRRDFLMPDETKIRAMARAMKKDAAALINEPGMTGVEVYNDPVIAARAKA